MAEPLVIADQGHFFTGLRRGDGGAVGGMHVQYQIPAFVRDDYALVLVHGGGGQGLDYLATPDGRPGWATLFLREGYAVYVVDRPGMGRSPYHPELHGAVAPLPAGFAARFAGPAPPGEPEHTQWPGSGVPGDPSLEMFLAGQERLAGDLASAHEAMWEGAAGLLDRIGPAAVVTHSLGGPFGWLAADARPELVRAVVAIEPFGPPFASLPGVGELSCGLTAVPVTSGLRGLPVAVVTAEASGHAKEDQATAEYLREAGAEVTELRLADLGIHGNGHLMMLERNNDEIARAISGWVTGHV
jgi:pimeloyl-ACP methyl ester carboxylesterase